MPSRRWAAAAMMAWVLLVGFLATMAIALVVGAACVVDTIREQLRWRGEGLIMHELISPAGELQDPQFADRRGHAYDESTADTTDHALMGRAPLMVQKTRHSVRHG